MFRKLLLLLPIFAIYGKPQPIPESKKCPESKTCTSVDFLFWSAGIEGTELAVSGSVISDTEISRSFIEMDGKWEPGVRAAIGHRFGHFDEWNLSAIWTYYHGRANAIGQDDGSLLFLRQGWTNFLGSAVVNTKGHWNFNLNVADIKLQRTYSLTKQVDASPYVAARGAFSALNLQASYSSLWLLEDEDHDVTFFPGDTHFTGDSKYLSGGICTGTSLFWNFNRNWSLFGDFGVSLLYGQFKVKEDFEGFDLEPDDASNPVLSPITSIYHDKKARVRATVDLLLGLKWEHLFSKERSRVSFFAGYELYQWFGLNQLFTVNRSVESYPINDTTNVYDANFSFDAKNGDVGLQGLTTRLSIEF